MTAVYTEERSGVQVNNSASAHVNILLADLVALITPGTSLISLSHDDDTPLTLSAADSFDPDALATTGGSGESSASSFEEDDEWSYNWTCVRQRATADSFISSFSHDAEGSECFVDENAGVRRNESELVFFPPKDDGLELDRLVFTVVVNKGSRTTSAQAVYTFVQIQVQ